MEEWKEYVYIYVFFKTYLLTGITHRTYVPRDVSKKIECGNAHID